MQKARPLARTKERTDSGPINDDNEDDDGGDGGDVDVYGDDDGDDDVYRYVLFLS